MQGKDDRSTFDDFKDFEVAYVGKKSTKKFRNIWKEYIENKSCLLHQMGVFRLDLEAMKSPLGCKKSGKPKKSKSSKKLKKSNDKAKKTKKNKG